MTTLPDTGRIQFKVLTTLPMTVSSFFLECHVFYNEILKFKSEFSDLFKLHGFFQMRNTYMKCLKCVVQVYAWRIEQVV